ncbi:FAD-dependent oxidoreductase [Kaistia defluvii]|uniref:NAD(P)/FAD-dependent oxidoreductase n=1 Tax=Kaistia defluvii TaxID=410841 RepID=UPI0022561D7C|nr:FAD-dependent oxidoreductase [Kaistia defluvii]MCX5518394.1 FAD-dependent oxidoreductase [Kaistia defluvii]
MRIEAKGQHPDFARRVAVVGSGISGLSAAWLLSRTMRVTLYESDTRLGGHSNTVVVPTANGPIPVDTGFIVYNERNYPNLVALFREIGVETAASEMSFAASLDGGRLEYSGSGLNGLMGQRGNVVRPRFWRMMRDILRFYREAPRLLPRTDLDGLTLGDYLDGNDYSPAFIEDHLLPMGAAIWSMTAREMRDYPLLAFVRFFASHGLLNLIDRPLWRTVQGGSRAYVERLSAAFTDGIRLKTPVSRITRETDRVLVTDASGHTDSFSDVVVATHADQALRLLGDADAQERSVLGAFRYTDNLAVLHSDETLMPKRKRVWSSWNYIGERQQDGAQPLCVTYWMNRLQNLDSRHPLFVTLNPTRAIDPAKVIESFHYTHPLFDQPALDAQQQLWRLQGRRNTWFCGAYFGYGFHEDGLQAGLAAAEDLSGLRRPWTVGDESGRIVLAPQREAAE